MEKSTSKLADLYCAFQNTEYTSQASLKELYAIGAQMETLLKSFSAEKMSIAPVLQRLTVHFYGKISDNRLNLIFEDVKNTISTDMDLFLNKKMADLIPKTL